MPLQDRRDEEHVRRFLARAHREPVVDFFPEHARSERPKTLTKLDLHVEGALNRRAARVGDDAPRAEGARAELRATLKPSDDLAFRHGASNALQEGLLIVELLVPGADLIEELLNLGVRIG